MAHEIGNLDVVGLLRVQAWHDLGIVIQDELSAEQAAERFGMVEPITQLPLVANTPQALAAFAKLSELSELPGVSADTLIAAFNRFKAAQIEVASHVANVQALATQAAANGADAFNLLGIVGADYSVCQNRDLAQFTDALAQSGRVVIESCGTIRNGRRVWFLAKGDAFNIGGTDQVWPYVLVSNGHDGTQAIRVTPTTVRVVCSNTLHMVIPRTEGERPETAAISIRHSGKISDKLEQAKRALAYYGDTLRRNVELFEAMQAKRVDQAQAMQLFADVYAANWEVATPDELASADAKVQRTAELRMERMRKASDAFMQRWADEQSRLGIGSTVWSAFNGVTGFIQHDKTARGADDVSRVEARRESNLFGINANRTHEALAASLALMS
jgi:phage/plasmid-like protein (TIGR03299 family)